MHSSNCTQLTRILTTDNYTQVHRYTVFNTHLCCDSVSRCIGGVCMCVGRVCSTVILLYVSLDCLVQVNIVIYVFTCTKQSHLGAHVECVEYYRALSCVTVLSYVDNVMYKPPFM